VKISIHSGLGNQLFQYTFFHYVMLKKELKYKIKIISSDTSRRDRSFEISGLLNYCSHHSEINSENNGTKSGVFMKLLTNYFFQFKEVNEFIFDEKAPSLITRFSRVHGYFQNWKYVDASFHIIGPEIDSFVKTVDVSTVKIPNRYIGIHIRRGDNLYTLKTMGSLSSKYYKKILLKINKTTSLPVVVFTDDVKGASDVLEIVSPDYLFGPSDLTVWQTLKLMSNSEYLITANSTFSWWAAILGFKAHRIKKVFIPDPWFRAWKTPVSTAFQFPSFETEKAEFIQQDHFDTEYRLN